MGKYMRKAKVSGEVAVMDVPAAPLGVRTRARALALQRLQKQQEGAAGEYLELRSRRLEKLPPPTPPAAAMRRKAAAAAAAAAAKEEGETEASYGENMLELEAMAERNTRETTPCSLINSQMISTPSTPGSTTRSSHSSHRRVKAPAVRVVPNSREVNAFLDAEQRRHHQAFIDKYNFDPVNDCPLPGKYEWAKLN